MQTGLLRMISVTHSSGSQTSVRPSWKLALLDTRCTQSHHCSEAACGSASASGFGGRETCFIDQHNSMAQAHCNSKGTVLVQVEVEVAGMASRVDMGSKEGMDSRVNMVKAWVGVWEED